MRVKFRQGVVKHEVDGNGDQLFLTRETNGNVTLNGQDVPVILTIANAGDDYLVYVDTDVTNAWSGFTGGTDYWLYVDIDIVTGARTFGSTALEPVFGGSKPGSPATGQHWYNPGQDRMFVYNGTTWIHVLRVFVCKYFNATQFLSLSDQSPKFIGTQVGDNDSVNAGFFLYDKDGKPLKKSRDRFFTTEDQAFLRAPSGGRLRLETTVIEATAAEPLPAFHAVYLDSFNSVSLANGYEYGNIGYGIVEHDYTTGEPVTVIFDGVVRNTEWNWSQPNIFVYVGPTGALTEVQASVLQAPIGIVVDAESIMIQPVRIDIGLEDGISLEDFVTEISTANAAENDILVNSSPDPLNATFAPQPVSYIMQFASIFDLSDTTNAPSPAEGDVLAWNSTESRFDLQQKGIDTIAEATDTNIGSAASGDLMLFDGSVWNATKTFTGTPYTFTGNVIVQGDFQVTGTTTTVESANLAVTDNEIVLNDGETGAGVSAGVSGLRIERGTNTDALLQFNEGASAWQVDPGTGTLETLVTSLTPLTNLNGIAISAATNYDVLTYNSGSGDFENKSVQQSFIDSTVVLNDITDVTITSVASDEILKWNGSAWVNVAITSILPTYALNDLTDAVITSPTNGQLLTYNGSSWVNLAPAVQSVNDLNDVIVSTPATNDHLIYNGTNWVNSPLAFGSLDDVNVAGVTNGQIIAYNSTSGDWEAQTNDPVTGRVIPYDIASTIAGPVSDGDLLMNFISVRSITIAQAGGHQAFAINLPTGNDVVFTVYHNGSSVGTVTIATSGTHVVNLTGTVNLVAGDRLRIEAPGSGVDASVTDVTVTLQGTTTIAAP